MNIAITGGAGYLGMRLARTLLEQESFVLDGRPARPIDNVTLLDQFELSPESLHDDRLSSVQIDLGTARPEAIAALPAIMDADVVFHLAAAVSAECEADFELGMRANVAGSHAVLDAIRLSNRRPVVIFASSVAVYGAWPGSRLPTVITDETLPTPRSSYGIQKFIVEQLVADYSRKEFIVGRTVRLMTVAVRPGRPNGAASSFLSSIIREPLAGHRAICPVSPDLHVVLSSPHSTIEGLMRAASAASHDWGPPLAVNLPGVHTTVAQMVEALSSVAGADAKALIDWQFDSQISDLVGSWPSRFQTDRANGLGLGPDADVEAIVRRYADERGA